MVTIYGTSLSRFKPRTCTIVFAAVIFSVSRYEGWGGIAVTAVSLSGKNTGKNIMIVGLAFGVFSLILFALCCSGFALRMGSNKGGGGRRFVGIASSLLFKGLLYGMLSLWLAVSQDHLK